MALQTNGWDYEIVEHAARHIRNVPGLTCEVGLREGGGSQIIIDALLKNDDKGRTHIALDPYGRLPYIQSETQVREDGPYPNEMMTGTLSELYAYIHGKPIHFLFFPFEDHIFFNKFRTGVPVYQDGRMDVINQYALTFLDGPHNLESTMLETVFFAERGVPGSVLVYDDICNYYDHSKIREYLESIGWKELELAPSKASYVKI